MAKILGNLRAGTYQCDLKNLFTYYNVRGISENVNPVHTELLDLLSGIEKGGHKGHYGHKITETNMMGIIAKKQIVLRAIPCSSRHLKPIGSSVIGSFGVTGGCYIWVLTKNIFSIRNIFRPPRSPRFF